MKHTILLFFLFIFSISSYGQEFVTGTIITQRYDTIKNVTIEAVSNAKSLLHLTYIDAEGIVQKPDIESIKCYTRGNENFTRIYNSGEMILVKQITAGKKLNLYERAYNGLTTYYVEKVFDEIVKVPSSESKFSRVLSDYLSDAPEVAKKIKSKELVDLKEIVALYNNG
ncbi:MAG: hypothetical protein CVU08_03200 [Bacteroidetes bacterium HGW-Bacteroidetes-3]|nr:MAG: hypothetical protein CVU08_03200 [Bacteroidetes bacterium HGW-Bacteroidetes-3]